MITYQPITPDDNTMYMIVRSDYPEAAIKSLQPEEIGTVLDKIVQDTANSANGTITYNSDTNLNGYPGRKTKIKVQGGLLYINCYLVDNSMYIAQVVCYTDKDGNESINRFLNAFDIIRVK